MKSEKKSHKVYLTPDEIPVWNWYKAQDGNLLYLMKLKDYNVELYVKNKYFVGRLLVSLFKKIPDNALIISATKLNLLQAAQKSIIYQLNEIESDILEAQKQLYQEFIELLIDIIDNSTDFEKRKDAVLLVGAMTITVIKNGLPDMNWLYNTKVLETRDQRKQLNNIANALANYKNRLNNQPTSDTLEDRIAKIEMIIGGGKTINPKKSTLAQFKAYEKVAINKLNQMENGNR